MVNRRLIIVILAVGLIISVSFNLLQYFQNNHISPLPQTKITDNPVPENRSLINGNISVSSYNTYYIEFYVGTNSFDAQVSGTFTVLNNSNIRVYITTPSDTNPGEPYFSPDYDSGYTTSSSINATLPVTAEGIYYYLVYNNQNSQTDTIVDTKISLSYVQT
jgi:hypothetical protein